MAKINSRKKGARGEKKAKEALEAWTNLEFQRVPMSGGLRWKKADYIAGDLICTDSLHRFDFCLEIKNYKEINFEHLLMPQVQSKILDEFWPQCSSDAERAKKLPLLMMRYDGMKPAGFFICVMYYKDFKPLKLKLDPKMPYFKLGKLIFMPSTKLFNSDYKTIKKITEKLIKTRWS